MASELTPCQIADALEKCDWAGASIGNKAIVSLAIEALRNTRPAPAATDTGLETVGEVSTVRESVAAFAGHMSSGQLKPGDLLCLRSQAEKLLAAERERSLFLKTAMEIAQTHCGLKDKTIASLEADNAAKDARIKELDRCHEGTIDLCNQKTAQIKALEAKLAAAREALEPFAQAALGYDDPDENGPWPDIQDVFVTLGDVRRARAALGGKPS